MLKKLPISVGEAEQARRFALTRSRLVDTSETVVGHLVRRSMVDPGRIALIDRDQRFTYAQMVDQVGAVRRLLGRHGVQPGDVVAVAGPRSANTVTAFLALESLGAVYLPLDPSWPSARIAVMLAQSRAILVLHHLVEPSSELLAAVAGAGVAAERMELSLASQGEDPMTWRMRCEEADEGRYAFYTSGSTGTPKGALLEQQGMINHLWAKIVDLGLDSTDVVAFSAPPVFGIAICQMLMPLLVGGTIAIIDDVHLRFPRLLVAELRRAKVTVLEAVPTLIGWMVDELEGETSEERLPALRWVISTGEELHQSLAERFFGILAGVGLLNAYGFTETSDDVAHHRLRVADLGEKRLPVGSPVPNATLYVLAQEGDGWHAVAPGEVGELFVGGVAVGRGYLVDPERTRSTFFVDVLDPASPTGRLYRTGDAVVVRNGVLYYLGRIDRQVKVAGVRIELGEIEATLNRHPDISQAAVVAFGEGERRHLVAYYISRNGAVTRDGLRALAQRSLPSAMIPRYWHAIAEFPLSGNGKIDYRRLAEFGKG